MTSFDKERDVREKNARVAGQLRAALDGPLGYLPVYLGGAKVHAAVRLTRGHSGYNHPRALCQRATPRSYAGAYTDGREVTCLRCIASLADLSHAVGARTGR